MKSFAIFVACCTSAMLFGSQYLLNFDFEKGVLPDELKGNAAFVTGADSKGKAVTFSSTAYMSVTAGEALKEAAGKEGIVFECRFFRDDIKKNGYILRQNNALSVSVISWDPKRINVGVWTKKGYVSIDTEPILKPGVWYDVKVTVNQTECILELNGKEIFRKKLVAPMRVSGNPIILGAGQREDGDRGIFGKFPVTYDHFRISKALPADKTAEAAAPVSDILPGAQGKTIFRFDFNSSLPGQLIGKASLVAGKPGFGKALKLEKNARLELKPSAAWTEAVKAGSFTFDCWFFRDEDDLKGTIIRQDRCFAVLVVPWDPKRLNIGLWTRKGYVSFDSEPCLNSGVWQHIAVAVNDGHCELLINGKREFLRKIPAPVRTSNYPIVIGGGYNADVSDKKFIGSCPAVYDDVTMSAGVLDGTFYNKVMAGTSENFEAVHNRIGLPPVCRPGREITVSSAPVVTRDAKTVKIENSFYIAEFSTGPEFRLMRLFNKYTGSECIGKGGTPLFAVNVADRHIKPHDFKVSALNVKPDGEKILLTADTHHAASGVKMSLSLTFDKSEDIAVNSVMTNGSKRQTLLPSVPFIENISIGPDFEENWYFWPQITGWAGKKSYELGLRYAHRCWIQFSAVYSPSLGGGITLTGQDTSGYAKGFIVRKTKKDGSIGVSYNQVGGTISPQENIFDRKLPGCAMAFAALKDTYAPGEKFSMPPAKLSVHRGDVLVPLMKYAKWSKKAFPHPEIPELSREDFCQVAVHRKSGNTGFDNRGLQGKGRFAFADYINPDGRDHVLQLAHWDVVFGECDCHPDFGGVEGMIKAIKEANAKGSKVTLYTCSRSVSRKSVHAKPEWHYQRKPGVGVYDWGGFNPCTAVPEWQDIFVGNNVRLAQSLPVSGIYLDTTAEILTCCNTAHPHPRNPVDSIMQLLKKARTRIKAVRPDIPIMTEYIGSEAFGMYIDACWVQTFANPHAHAFNNYDLDFARFVYPRVKYFEWGQGEKTFEVDARRAFFNGVGGARGDLTSEQAQRHADMTNAQKDMYEALTCDDPEPLVKSGTDKFFINFFPGKKQTVWTYYCKNQDAKSASFTVPAKFRGKRFIEVLSDRELSENNGTISVDVKPFEIGMIAAFDRLLSTEKRNDKIVVKIAAKNLTPDARIVLAPRKLDRKNFHRTISGKQLNQEIIIDPAKNGIVKLFHGRMLVDEIILL